MDKVKKWHNTCVANEIVEVLKNKKYNALYAEDLQQARQILLDMIPENASIALGGSVTLGQMDIIDTFREGKYQFFDRYQKSSFPETVEVMRQSMLADYLVTSTNAITRNGELVNVDCSGNRVSGMIFGPKKVIIIAGANKVVDTLDDAMKRLKKIAPLNAKRLGHKTPCVQTGKCMDCDTKQRMCNYVTIINHGMKFEDRITVIVVAEELGY